MVLTEESVICHVRVIARPVPMDLICDTLDCTSVFVWEVQRRNASFEKIVCVCSIGLVHDRVEVVNIHFIALWSKCTVTSVLNLSKTGRHYQVS